MKYTIAIAITIAVLFSGCTKSAIMKTADRQYVGQSMDNFVLDYGHPQSKSQSTDGTYTYQWIFKGKASTPTSYSTGISNKICILDIHTQNNGEIISFKIIKDTTAEVKGYSSMCAQSLSR